MKRIIIAAIIATGILSCCLPLQAQDATVIKPAPYDASAKRNYVRTWDGIKPLTNPNDLSTTSSLQEARITTQYQDGLGRPVQTVVKQGSLITGSSAVDLVAAIVYDSLGREVRQYLPFAANSYGSNTFITDGLFKLNPFDQQNYFFSDSNNASPIKGQGYLYYYNKIEYEASPLDRIDRTYAAGDSWVHNGKGVKMKYWVNTTTDSVRVWTVADNSGAFGSYTTTARYNPGELFKNVTIDENDKQVIEFKDTEGKVILKKFQITANTDDSTGQGHFGWLCTYYIYDDLNQLRAVVQPKGVELLLAHGWDITWNSNVILNEQCFRYEYNERGLVTMKKVPGADVIYMVYDARDRMVLMQDGNLRNGSPSKWQYAQYDLLNRPVAAGLWNNSNSLAYHSERADTSIAYPNLSGQTIEELTNTFYDNYNWLSSYTTPLHANRNDSFDIYLLNPSNVNYPYPQEVSQSAKLKGLVTGTRFKILNTSDYLYSINYYDEQGRVIQTEQTNYTGVHDVQVTQYSFSGQPVFLIQKQGKGGANSQTSIVLTQMSYDTLGRVVKIEKKTSNSKVNSGNMPASWTTIIQNEYDALGQLKKKKIGNTPIDSFTYDYNIRGWVLGANREYLKDTTSTSNFFGFDLGYDKGSFKINGTPKSYVDSQYNGNIAGMLWKSTGDRQLRKYDFSYDYINRLTGAAFTQLTNNSFGLAAGIDYSVSGITYDANGNLLTMNQRGWKATGSETIDSLLYTYISNSNRLLNVIDRRNDTLTTLGDFRSSKIYMRTFTGGNKTISAADYTYDNNGNNRRDYNKEISNINYNFLNLPEGITVDSQGTIIYKYDAFGNKIQKEVYPGAQPPGKITMYLGNAVFYQDTLQFLSMEEGRIRFDTAKKAFHYDYFVKDHLGNVRMVLTEQNDTSFYPPVTFEDAAIANESIYYDSVNVGQTSRPGSFYESSSNGGKVQLLRKSTHSIGAGKLLKVMARDRIHVKVDYFVQNDATDNNGANGINSIISVLANILNYSSITSGFHSNGSIITNNLNSSFPFTDFLAPQTGSGGTMPKAYLNILFFDEQFRFIRSSSEIVPVTVKGSGQTIYRIDGSAKEAEKNGYVYVFVSNESNNLVYFDNLQVTHERGPITEETHYYPFGLTMAGISSKALNFGEPDNKKKYNGIEKEDGFGIEIYDAQLRELDPQIGKWWQIDPKVENMEMWSPYASNYDNPIRYSDPLGDEGAECCAGLKQWLSERWEAQKRGFWLAGKRIGEAASQAGENAKNNWNAGNDPIHQAMMYPLSTLGGPVGAEINAAKTVVNLEVKAVATEVKVLESAKKAVQPYEVGAANDLRARSVPWDGIEIHHAPQSHPSSKLVQGYNEATAPTIALPKVEHKAIPTFKGTQTAQSTLGTTPQRAQLAKDIRDLRQYTNAPNSSLQKLIELTNKQFHGQFEKPPRINNK